MERRLVRRDPVERDVEDIAPPPQADAGRAVRDRLALAFLAVVSLGVPVGSLALAARDTQAWRAVWDLARTPAAHTLRSGALATAAAACLALGLACTALDQVPSHLVEAAALDGATGWQALRHVIFPLLRPATLAVAAAVFVLATGDIASTILLHPPGGETLAVALYGIEANAPRAWVAALALLNGGFCVFVLGVLALALSRSRPL
jgi:ABC-type Fe3+ transport system permease subunit